MKKIISIVCAIALVNVVAFAQPGKDKKGEKEAWQERVRIERIAYITAELNLTEAEAQAFWPVFNDIQNKRQEAQAASRKAFIALESATAENAAALMDDYIKAKNEINKINEEALPRYKKVLPVEKVAKLLVADENFRRNQIGKLGGKGGHGGHGNGGHGKSGHGNHPNGPRPGGFPGAPQMDE